MTAPSAQVDPTRILEDAVADFRSALTPEEQIRLDNEYKGGLPDANAAFTFTASLDRINATKRRGQSVASRLFSLIQSVQQFTNIIDTYVSANPEISALVWSSMKLTFMVIANLVSYFEAFSKLFLRFEGMRPRFEEYSLLFPSSVRLRTALCHFHASIIKCCKEAIVISRRPWQHQLFHVFFSSFQTEMMPLVQDIELKAKEVKSEILLAKAQADRDEHLLQEQERREASRHRHQITQYLSQSTNLLTRRSLSTDDWRKEVDHRRSVRRKKELLGALSTFNYMAAFKQARRRRFPNTCQWFASVPGFSGWCESNESSALILSGKIGAGKTVLSGAILDHLFQQEHTETSILFYHVCFDKPESLQAETLIRSLIRQKLDPELLSDELHTLLIAAESSMFSLESLYNLLERKLIESKTTYIIIDGIDELTPDEEKLTINTLRRLLKHPMMVAKLLLSCRDSRTNDLRKKFIGAHQLSLNADGVIEDMKYYITQVIDEKIEAGDLVVGDDTLVAEIRDALAEGHQGMFLWVALEIEDVCFQCTDAAIRGVLQDLPKDLTETFNRALQRILIRGKHTKEAAGKVLKILTAVKRPLKLSELAEAASIEAGQQYWKPGQEFNNIAAVSAWCENLVAVDEESQVVQFVHHTVKKFILQSPTSSTYESSADSNLDRFHFSIQEANHFLGEICVTYLGLNDFKTAITKRLKPLPVLDPRLMATSALKSRWKSRVAENLGGLVNSTGQPIVVSGGRTKVEAVARLESFRSHGSEPLRETTEDSAGRNLKEIGPFLDYARTFWLEHTAGFSQRGPTHPSCWKLFLEMIPGTHHIARTPWTEQQLHDLSSKGVIEWADSHLHFALLRHLLLDRTNLGNPDWPLKRRLGLLASRPEHEEEGRLVTAFRGYFSLSHEDFMALYGEALAESATTGFLTELIPRLHYSDADCQCKTKFKSHPLMEDLCDSVRYGVRHRFEFSKLVLLAAAWHGNIPTLRAHLDVRDSARTMKDGKTALHIAAEAGHLAAVKELVAGSGVHGLRVKTRSSPEKTPLHLAMDGRHHNVVQYILSKGGALGHRVSGLGPPPPDRRRPIDHPDRRRSMGGLVHPHSYRAAPGLHFAFGQTLERIREASRSV